MHRRDLRRCLSVGVASVRRFLFLLAFFSMPAFSVPYYWTLSNPGSWPGGSVLTGVHYETPAAACAAGASAYNGGPDGWQVTGHSVSYVSATSYTCTLSLRYPANGSTTTSSKSIFRSGTECVSPAVYNASTGLCDVPVNKCEAKFGQDQPFKLTGNINDPNSPVKKPASGGQVAMPDISVDGCAAQAIKTQCLFHGNGAYTCSGTARYTGQKGNTNPALDQPLVELEPELTSDSEQQCTDWVEDAEGRRTKTCETSSSSDQSGKNTCERGQYDQYCFQGSPTPNPESATAQRTDNIKETINADGSKTTETTSTTNNTYCSFGACTTTTTTNKTTVVTGSDGKVQSESSSCSGDECAKPEDPKKGEMPGAFTPGDKGEYLPTIGDGEPAPTYSESLENFTDRVAASPLVSSIQGITVPSGGSCSIGSASLFGGSVSFNDFCTLAPEVLAGLRYLFLAIWAWAAIRLLFTA